MSKEKIYSLLGLAARMRKLSYGKERIRAYMRSPRRQKLVIVAVDSSDRLKRDLRIRARNTGTRLLIMFQKSELGKLLGKGEVSALVVEDDGILRGIIEAKE